VAVKRPPHAVTVELSVPFHDCDPLFVVWHGNYFKYLEAARQALLRSLELDIPDMIDLGHRMYVADAHCRYMFPLTYGETVRVTAWITECSPLIKVVYDVFNQTRGRRCARASTVLAVTDREGGLLTEIPDSIFERLPPSKPNE
jgi:acyl-CoA thioester hydrolase